MSELTITQADRGRTFEVKSGDVIAIYLPEIPTSGYRWAIDQTDKQLLALQNSEFSQQVNAGVGGGGQCKFTFESKSSGVVKLQLKNWREWEGDTSIIDRFDVAIIIS